MSDDFAGSLKLGALGISVLGLGVAHAGDATTASPIDYDGDGDDDGKVSQVTVHGVRSLLDDKLPGDQLDVPQSLTVVSEKLMTEQGSTRLEDALKECPGHHSELGRGRGAWGYGQPAWLLRLQ